MASSAMTTTPLTDSINRISAAIISLGDGICAPPEVGAAESRDLCKFVYLRGSLSALLPIASSVCDPFAAAAPEAIAAGGGEKSPQSLRSLFPFTRRRFPKERDSVETIELLNSLVALENGGHNAAVRCLFVWQDLQESAFALSALIDEFRFAESGIIGRECGELALRLLEFAPDAATRFRIRHELDVLHFERHLEEISKRFDGFEDLIGRFRSVNTPANDADSGTFSSEEEDSGMSAIPSDLRELNDLIGKVGSADELILFLRQLIKAEKSPNEKLKELTSGLSEPLAAAAAPPAAPPPPPPPPPPPLAAPPSLKASIPPPPPPPGAPPSLSTSPFSTPKSIQVPNSLKPKVLPPEGKKLRHLQWTKIPPTNLGTERNVWMKMDSLDVVKTLDFTQLDSFFSFDPKAESPQTATTTATAADSEPKIAVVSLLSSKRSLSVNVFLKSLKGFETLIEFIGNGETEEEGMTEKLRMALPLLPSDEESQTLRNYSGSRKELGSAECFLLALLDISDFRLRIDSLILREEFGSFTDSVESNLDILIVACRELRESPKLRTVLLILLHLGNYLNHGGGLGNAVAFKLTSLWKIDELRAIRGGCRTLLHIVAEQSLQMGVDLEEIAHVDEAARLPFEALKSDIRSFRDRLKLLNKQIESKTEKFFLETKKFFTISTKRMDSAEKLLETLESERKLLSEYFCENEKTFSLEECFRIFSNFRNRFQIAANENKERTEREKRTAERSGNLLSISSAIPSASPLPSRRASAAVIQETDRDRRTFPSTSSAVRRRSTVRRESAFDAPMLNGDLDSFVDKALQMSGRNGQRSRLSPEAAMPPLAENSPTIAEESHKHSEENPTAPKPKETPKTKSEAPKESPPPLGAIQRRSAINRVRTRQSNEPTKPEVPKTVTAALRPSQIRASQQTPTEPKSPIRASPSISTPISRETPKPSNRTEPTTEKTPNRTEPPKQRRTLSNKIEEPKSPLTIQLRAERAADQPKTPSQIRAEQPKANQKAEQPKSPSEIKAEQQKAKPNGTVRNSEVRRPLTSRPSLSRQPSQQSQRRVTVPKPAIPTATTTTANRTKKPPLSAAERRALYKTSDSVSTASRPALIKTGSTTEKPRWFP